jgi:hypothetical protein
MKKLLLYVPALLLAVLAGAAAGQRLILMLSRVRILLSPIQKRRWPIPVQAR